MKLAKSVTHTLMAAVLTLATAPFSAAFAVPIDGAYLSDNTLVIPYSRPGLVFRRNDGSSTGPLRQESGPHLLTALEGVNGDSLAVFLRLSASAFNSGITADSISFYGKGNVYHLQTFFFARFRPDIDLNGSETLNGMHNPTPGNYDGLSIQNSSGAIELRTDLATLRISRNVFINAGVGTDTDLVARSTGMLDMVAVFPGQGSFGFVDPNDPNIIKSDHLIINPGPAGGRGTSEARQGDPLITSLTTDLALGIGDVFAFGASATDWLIDTTRIGTLDFSWDLDGDGEYDDFNGMGANHAFGQAGLHEVGLRVSNSFGFSTTDSFFVTVNGPTSSVPGPASLGLLALGLLGVLGTRRQAKS